MKDKKTYKDLFSKAGYPNVLAPDEIKEKEEYGLQFAKAIEQEWFFRPERGSCTYYDKRSKYHSLRLYARGEQETSLYKKLLGGEGSTYSNYDWRPLQVLPKFVKLIVNQMTERLFDIKAEAVDEFSTDLKNKYKSSLEDYVYAKPIMEAAKATLGVDIMPDNAEEYPETQEEVDLFMKLKYKPAIEIATEEALKFTLEMNDYDETQSRVIEDITTLGLGAIKHTTDPSKGIVVDWVDPARMVYSTPQHRNFKNVNYFGEVDRISINELKRISNGKFDDEELKDISESTTMWSQYHQTGVDDQYEREDDLSGTMVDVMYFTFKSTKTLSYKKKYNKNKGFKMIKKESTFDKKDSSYTGYDVSKKVIDVWYEGAIVLGTNKIFNYKMCENMIRPKGYLNITYPNYIMYAPDLYQNKALSTVEKVVPYIDQMQIIHIKLQQMIAKARPNGIYIDVTGLNEVTLGDGSSLDPMELINIYDQTGNVLGASSTIEGDYNYGQQPIKELNNGIVQGVDRLIMAYNHYLGLLRDAIGIPQGADASNPHPDTLVGVQQMVALNSNTATRHILDAGLNISERLGKGLSLRLKDIFTYSDLRKVYINAIGTANVEILKAIQNLHLHDLGINIELKPDAQEKQFLEGNIAQALGKELITLDDAIDIRNIGNTKLANELLKTRRIRREKEKRNHEKEMMAAQSQSAQAAAQAGAQAKQQELQMKSEADVMVIRAKSEAKMMELEKEAAVKAGLMDQEFQYNMQLRGIDAQAMATRESQKEDRKDQRIDKQSTNQSKLKEQAAFGKRAQNFESSEDNISGSIELSEMEPS